jgi:pimeloyl-ACP methyl ester carboxylesterase
MPPMLANIDCHGARDVTHWIAGSEDGGWTAPHLAAKAAFNQFSTPPRGPTELDAETKLHEKLDPLLDQAELTRLGTPDAFIQTYLWRSDTAPSRGRVLLIHGWTGQALIMGLFVRPLLQAGFDVVALDQPAHGRSTGRLLNMPIGARAVLATADRHGPFSGVVTHSFGGQVAALALEGGPPIGRRFIADRLVTVACPHSLQRLTRNFGRGFKFPADLQTRFEARISEAAGRPIETVNTGNMLAVAGLPVLAIHDERDDEVPYSEAEAIAAAAPNVTLMPLAGLGHRRIIVTSAVIRTAIRFLQ